jgi:hypothetical protein
MNELYVVLPGQITILQGGDGFSVLYIHMLKGKLGKVVPVLN